MMKGIFNHQIHVIEEFSRHLQNLYEKETFRESTNEGASPSMLKVLVDIKQLLEDQKQNGIPNPAQSINRKTSASQSRSGLVVGKTIPSHTLHLAEDVSRDMKYRRDELEKLEESTNYVCDQVIYIAPLLF